jgi:hypothetical protein
MTVRCDKVSYNNNKNAVRTSEVGATLVLSNNMTQKSGTTKNLEKYSNLFQLTTMRNLSSLYFFFQPFKAQW